MDFVLMITHVEKVQKLHIKADFKGEEPVKKCVNPTLFSEYMGQKHQQSIFFKRIMYPRTIFP